MAHLICVSGSLGAGKTTFASFFPWLLKNLVEQAGGELELFANYDLHGAKRMDKLSDWYEVAEAHGSIIVWDEAHRTFNNRRWSSFQNIFAVELITFVRKMASIQIFATPSVFRLDTAIRDLIEVLIIARKAGNGTYYDFYDFQADFAGKYGKLLHTKFLPNWKRQKVHDLDLFDSNSFVSGFPMPKDEKSAERFMRELEKAHWRGVNRRRKEVIEVDVIKPEPGKSAKNRKRPAKASLPVSPDAGKSVQAAHG